jgi:sarcosine oxidase delta subunit
MRYLIIIAVILVFSACEKEKGKLPEGFEWVGRDGRTHFAYVHKEYIGDKIFQREAGRIVCGEMFQHQDYCEIFMWSNRNSIPKRLPVINRKEIIGIFEMKGETLKLKALKD